MSGKLQWQTPSLVLVWRTPKLTPQYDAFAEPEAWDQQRSMIEDSFLHRYTDGVSADELLEAMRHMTVDLLDAGHYPSRHLLGRISAELQALYWPDQGKPEQEAHRSHEQAQLAVTRLKADHLAATKYKGRVNNPRTEAEKDVAESMGLSVFGLRKRNTRYRKRIKKSVEERWRRRSHYPKA